MTCYTALIYEFISRKWYKTTIKGNYESFLLSSLHLDTGPLFVVR